MVTAIIFGVLFLYWILLCVCTKREKGRVHK